MTKNKRSAPIVFRVTDAVKEAAETLARRQDRSLSNLLRRLLIAHCKRMGTLPKDWKDTNE